MELTSPGPTLGVVGGGQLGRMLGEAAGPLGVDVVVSDPTPDCPASPVVADQVVGDFDDEATVLALAKRADVLTYEIELADPDALERASDATGTPVHPDPDTLRTIQDKLVQNRMLDDAGIPVPAFRRVDDADDLRAAGDELGWPVMLKARQGGYDGRGNVPVSGPDDAEDRLREIGVVAGDAVDGDAVDGGQDTGGALAEAMVDFERELSVVGVVGDAETAAYPVTETVHEDEILRETVNPARTDPAVRERARAVAFDVLEELSGRGVYGIELFECASNGNAPGDVLVNEIAPRPHNSGHWTIEGAYTSQFANHVRSVLGWPLGSCERRCPTVTANVLGDVDDPRPARLSGVETVLDADRASLHWYGKREVRPLRKMGHVTVLAADDEQRGQDALLDRTRQIRDALSFD